jgi:hypothetical protein
LQPQLECGVGVWWTCSKKDNWTSMAMRPLQMSTSRVIKCCKQFPRNSYRTGQAEIEAAKVSAELMPILNESKLFKRNPTDKVEETFAS